MWWIKEATLFELFMILIIVVFGFGSSIFFLLKLFGVLE